MNEPKININVMPGAQMNGYVKEQHNYFGNVQKLESGEANAAPVVDAVVMPPSKPIHQNAQERDEERFHFVHPELDDEEAWHIHDTMKRLVAYQKVPEICAYLKELKQKGKVMLPSVSAVMYKELVRLGMPTGDGYSDKHFSNSYTK